MSRTTQKRFLAALTSAMGIVLITGCGGGGGGGGGGSSSPSTGSVSTPHLSERPQSATNNTQQPTVTPPIFPDGLGTTGRAPGTALIGTAQALESPTIQNSIAVTNSGKVLTVWAESASSSNLVYTNQRSVGGTWNGPSSLPQIVNLGVDIHTGLPLRVNSNGDGVLGWTEQLPGTPVDTSHRKSRLLRFSDASGWSPSAIDLLSPVTPVFGQMESSDLQILDDGTVTFSDLIKNSTNPSPVTVYRQSSNGVPTAIRSYGSLWFPNSISFVSDPLGNGFVGVNDGANVLAYAANISNGTASPTAITLANDPLLCWTGGWSTTAYDRRSHFAVSNQRYSVFSFGSRSSSCTLMLGTQDATTGLVTVTSTNTSVTKKPLLAMDKVGNGVAIWYKYDGITDSNVPMSAQSSNGGAWNAPHIIGNNGQTVGIPDPRFPLRFALNRAGQGVAAMVITRDYIPYIATARYSLSGGWTDWTLVATAPSFSIPNVALNDSGDAFLVYAAQSCTRTGSGIDSRQCGDKQHIYVLKL